MALKRLPKYSNLDKLIADLEDMRKRMGNLPVVIQDSVGVFDELDTPTLRELEFWDVVDSTLPPAQADPPPIPKPGEAALMPGRRVVVLKAKASGDVFMGG